MTRHVKRIEIALALLRWLLVEGVVHPAWVVTQGVSQDATLVAVAITGPEVFPGVVSVVFEHPSFPEVPEGHSIVPSQVSLQSFWPLPEPALQWQAEHAL